MRLVTAFGVLLLGSLSFALTTAYVAFEHPEGWRCELSQGVWICQSTLEPDRKESLVMSIATMATEWDTLENYEQYLKQSRGIPDEEGNNLNSTVTYARKRNINGVMWVDSLQHNSELPGFWTRYLATMQNKLAILITYIVSDDRYSQLAPQFERMVSSLKPNQEFDLNIATKQGDGPLPGSAKLGPIQQEIFANRLNLRKKKKEAPPSSSPLGTLLMLGAGASAGFYVWKRRKKARMAKGNSPTTPPVKKVS